MSVAVLDPRDQLYKGLRSRNRVVGVLRWAVPAAGVALLLVLVGQVMLGSLAEQYGISNIQIDRDNLVVDAPRMSGTLANGVSYKLEAVLAHAALENTSLVTLDEAHFTLARTGGETLVAEAKTAMVELGTQKVAVPGVTNVTSSSGMKGTLGAMSGDIPGEVLAAADGVDMMLTDGTRLTAKTMRYELKARRWEFGGGVSVTLPLTPGDRP